MTNEYTKKEAKAKESEETPPVVEFRISQTAQPPIHIKAGVCFFSRFIYIKALAVFIRFGFRLAKQ